MMAFIYTILPVYVSHLTVSETERFFRSYPQLSLTIPCNNRQYFLEDTINVQLLRFFIRSGNTLGILRHILSLLRRLYTRSQNSPKPSLLNLRVSFLCIICPQVHNLSRRLAKQIARPMGKRIEKIRANFKLGLSIDPFRSHSSCSWTSNTLKKLSNSILCGKRGVVSRNIIAIHSKVGTEVIKKFDFFHTLAADRSAKPNDYYWCWDFPVVHAVICSRGTADFYQRKLCLRLDCFFTLQL